MTQAAKNNETAYYDLLQDALDKGLIILSSTEVKFPSIFVVRATRYDPDNHSVIPEIGDFFSQIQLAEENGAKNIDVLKEYWGNYSCSCFVCSEKIKTIELPIDFVSVEELQKKFPLNGLINLMNAMKLPRKNKKRAILVGKVNPTCGTIVREGTHIHWFIYKNARPQDYFSEWGVIYEKMGKSGKRGRIKHRTSAD